MPQLGFLYDPVATTMRWEYAINPLKPEERPMFTATVHDAHGLAIDMGFARIPYECVHEAVDDLLSQTWMAYLFGERDDVRKIVGTRSRVWSAHAETRSLP